MLSLREQYPRWGKDKLVILLHRQGFQVSTSRVGRILKRLKERGVLKEPPRNGVATSRHHRPRPYAVRKPRDYVIEKPWRPGPGGYPGCASFAWGSAETLHCQGEALTDNGVLDLGQVKPALYLVADRYLTAAKESLRHLERKVYGGSV